MLREMASFPWWNDAAGILQWLEDRISGKPPYIIHDDIILNRNNRHLIDEYNLSLTVAPSYGSIRFERPDQPANIHPYKTIAFSKASVRFSPSNRNHRPDYFLITARTTVT